MFYEKFQNFHFLTMSKVKMGHILPKRKKCATNLFEYSIISDKLPEFDEKFKKCRGKIDSFLPWTQDSNWTLRLLFYAQVQNSCSL